MLKRISELDLKGSLVLHEQKHINHGLMNSVHRFEIKET